MLYTLLYSIRAREINRTIWRMAHAKDIWQDWHKTAPDQKTGTGMTLKKVKVFLLRSEKFGGDWNNSYLCNYFYSKSKVFML